MTFDWNTPTVFPDMPAPVRPRRAVRSRMTARSTGARRPDALTVFGEALLTLGVLVALFGAWQFWWTDYIADRKQADAVADLEWAHVPETVPPSASLDDVPPSDDHFADATTIAVIRVPRFGEDYVRPISEGVDKKTVLDALGIGHYPGTAAPGEVGNFVLIGHRTTYGKPFNRIADLRHGDAITVETPDASYTYKVTSDKVIRPNQIDVIEPVPFQPGVPATNRTITLISCHPMFSARQRYVVHGELESWYPKQPLPSAETNGAS